LRKFKEGGFSRNQVDFLKRLSLLKRQGEQVQGAPPKLGSPGNRSPEPPRKDFKKDMVKAGIAKDIEAVSQRQKQIEFFEDYKN